MKDAVALKDLSILAPLTIKDMIWIEVERSVVAELEAKAEGDKFKYLHDRFDRLDMYLADIKHLSLLIEYDARIDAMKESKGVRRQKPVDAKKLPSTAMEKAKKEVEMTEEQKREAERKRFKRQYDAILKQQRMNHIRELVESAKTPEDWENVERAMKQMKQEEEAS